jgi:hypothetical protein
MDTADHEAGALSDQICEGHRTVRFEAVEQGLRFMIRWPRSRTRPLCGGSTLSILSAHWDIGSSGWREIWVVFAERSMNGSPVNIQR